MSIVFVAVGLAEAAATVATAVARATAIAIVTRFLIPSPFGRDDTAEAEPNTIRRDRQRRLRVTSAVAVTIGGRAIPGAGRLRAVRRYLFDRRRVRRDRVRRDLRRDRRREQPG